MRRAPPGPAGGVSVDHSGGTKRCADPAAHRARTTEPVLISGGCRRDRDAAPPRFSTVPRCRCERAAGVECRQRWSIRRRRTSRSLSIRWTHSRGQARHPAGGSTRHSARTRTAAASQRRVSGRRRHGGIRRVRSKWIAGGDAVFAASGAGLGLLAVSGRLLHRLRDRAGRGTLLDLVAHHAAASEGRPGAPVARAQLEALERRLEELVSLPRP
jgi:hypothetical protein